MSNYILKYTKDERVRYISHLDFVRVFHRSVRRAGVDFLYSQGFNPHPLMAVAVPLSVGVTSSGEYMRAAFSDELSPEEIKKRINNSLPLGFEVVEITKLTGKEIDISKIDRAEYTVEAEIKNPENIDIQGFLNFSELKVLKRSKSGVKECDIRPYIYSIELVSVAETSLFKMCLACGGSFNLKPETVIDAMKKYIGVEVEFVFVHRDRLIL